MNRLLDDVYADDLVRAVYLMAPTASQLLQMAIPKNSAAMIGYLSTRAASEQLAALRKRDSVRAARAMVGANDPFVVFPALHTPASLAKALDDNDALLEWIFETTEPNAALTRLARDPVRNVAGEAMQRRATVYDSLPSYDKLTAEGRRAFDAIAKGFDDDETKDDAESYRDGNVAIDPALDRRAKELAAAGAADLPSAIAKLDHAGAADKASMLALVRDAAPSQQVALLDGGHTSEVRVVRRTTQLAPQHVFPGITVLRLFGLPDAAEWLLLREAPTTVLELVATHKAARPFAKALDVSWIDALPRGGALTATERHTLDEVAGHVTDLAVKKALFAARFDVAIEGSFDLDEVGTLWSIAQRLPAAQIDQQAIRAISEKSIGPLGQWANPDIELDDDARRFEKKDTSADLGQKLTLDEVKRHYKMTDQEIAVASEPNGWLTLDNGLYTVAPIHTDQFTATVLHEIGHSIDTLLGEHTELIFGIGGWKTYGLDQFDQWAAEMGGLDAIDAKDRPKVTDAWKHALRVNKSAGDLVGDDHPAMADENTASPLVQAARDRHSFYYTSKEPPVINDRVFLNRGGLLSSIPNQTFQTAPSSYSLYAPAEYFAECYVEYYREFDGTKPSGKGGRLAGWIKEWFDKYVDKIKLHPNRVRPKAEE